MKNVVLIATMLTTIAVAQEPTSRPETTESVWIWSRQCNGDRKLGVTVHLRRKVLYRGVLQICRGSREDGRAQFHFGGGHFFQGEYRTQSTDSIEGDLWQAGGETDALILGISFNTGKQILLNTLHIAKPDMQTSSELDKGLSITTYPLRAR